MFETMLNSISNDPNAGISDPGKPSILIERLLPYIFGAAGIVLLLNIVGSGLRMMTSKGDPKVLQGAQTKITTSLIGILILSFSFVLVQFIMGFLGINISIFN